MQNAKTPKIWKSYQNLTTDSESAHPNNPGCKNFASNGALTKNHFFNNISTMFQHFCLELQTCQFSKLSTRPFVFSLILKYHKLCHDVSKSYRVSDYKTYSITWLICWHTYFQENLSQEQSVGSQKISPDNFQSDVSGLEIENATTTSRPISFVSEELFELRTVQPLCKQNEELNSTTIVY